MYCHKCGKPMEPHYTGRCPACSYKEYIKNTSFEELSEDMEKVRKAEQKKDNKTLIAVIVAGLFCPLIWIVYFLYKNWGSVEKWAMSSSGGSGYSGSSGSYTGGTSGASSTSTFGDSSSEKKFVFTDGRGNLCESGGLSVIGRETLLRGGVRFAIRGVIWWNGGLRFMIIATTAFLGAAPFMMRGEILLIRADEKKTSLIL